MMFDRLRQASGSFVFVQYDVLHGVSYCEVSLTFKIYYSGTLYTQNSLHDSEC